MSISSHIPCCVAIVLAALVLLQTAETVSPEQDRDRAVLTYNLESDSCYKLNEHSHEEEIAAANWSCLEAFKALDQIKGNSCSGWRHAACRLITGSPYVQCSCKILTCSEYTIKSDVTKPFRECAFEFRNEEARYGRVALSAGYQKAAEGVESDLEKSRSFWKWFNSVISYNPPPEGEPSIWEDEAEPSTSTSVATIRESAKPYPSPQVLVCKFCGKTYTSINSFKQHVRSHTTPGTTCGICNKVCSTRSNLTKHMKSRHEQEYLAARTLKSQLGAAKDASRESVRKTYACDVCRRVYKSPQNLRYHKKSHEYNLICKVCIRKFVSRLSFDTHIKKTHPRYEEVASRISDEEVLRRYNEANPHVCFICEMRYAMPKSLKDHMQSHLTDSTTCTECNRVYSTISNYYQHRKNKHGEYPPGAK